MYCHTDSAHGDPKASCVRLGAAAGSGSGAEPGSGASAAGVPRGMSLKEIERQAILQAIEDCDGNRTQAAKLLDIDRSTLRRKLAEFDAD